MNQRQASTAVLLHQRERRAADLFGADAETLREPAYERGLSSAQVADQEQHGPRRERRGELASDIGGFVLRMRGDRHHRFNVLTPSRSRPSTTPRRSSRA